MKGSLLARASRAVVINYKYQVRKVGTSFRQSVTLSTRSPIAKLTCIVFSETLCRGAEKLVDRVEHLAGTGDSFDSRPLHLGMPAEGPPPSRSPVEVTTDLASALICLRRVKGVRCATRVVSAKWKRRVPSGSARSLARAHVPPERFCRNSRLRDLDLSSFAPHDIP